MQDFPTLRETFAILPELMLTLFACGALVLDILLPRGQKQWTAWFCLLGIALTGVAVWQSTDIAAGNGLGAFYGMVVIDGYSLVFKIVFLAAAALATALAVNFLDIENAQHGEYYALILFATVGMMFMASGTDFITLYVALELMALSVYVLVGYLKRDKKSNEAALKYFLLGVFSSGILLYGMSLVYALTGTTNLAKIASALADLVAPKPPIESPRLLILAAMVAVGAGLLFKVAAVPFHMWAPDAYQGAPTSVTMFMSVGPKAAAYAMLARIFLVGFEPVRTIGDLPGWALMLGIAAALTMTVGNLAAVTQSNTKRLLAYSSISHAGYILLGVVAGNEIGYTGVVLYLTIYTLMNAGAFGVILTLHRQGILGEKVDDLNGLFHKSPGLAVMMLVFLLSLAGIPMTGGFIGKYYLFGSLIQSDTKWMNYLAVVAVLNTAVSFYYYARIIKAMFAETSTDETPLALSSGLRVSLVTAVVLIVLCGVYPNPFIQFSKAAVSGLPTHRYGK